ncbi:murein biosynthesis integral membrane protein MurJ [Bailinhaonella thermotolerans]|uniref:Probable lipid II flippase MurJ n=1 Tax=Bailinhaonella thermotolerans TaxID=1070861 RepID=A0A3A4AU37_9ACTN|nr:murein biosynthesis integral membrane protein MurJ [Bailinhaonella thermotolerans]RJL32139.1 murein biosynthesis integral membrane protein MurJ [Bailinhaonella thermotolerans]
MSNLLRAGAVMMAGTLMSRITGFARTAVIAAAIGLGALGDAYSTATVIPVILFDLLLGGLLSSVVVPMVVRARKTDPDGGEAYEQRLLTLVTLILIGLSVAAVALAGPIIGLYGSAWREEQREVATTLARFILPQIAFFGVGALAGAYLNVREKFAAPMWAPVLNNLVVIAVAVIYIAIGGGSSAEGARDNELALLGLGTTAGIVVQSIVLVITLRRVGFRFRPRFDFNHSGIGDIARKGSWTLAYLGITQLGFMAITNLANWAGVRAAEANLPYDAGQIVYANAYNLFQLPYGVIAVSVITALLPRMSGYAHEGRFEELREEFAGGVRLVSAALVPAALLLVSLGPAITSVVFPFGNSSPQSAYYLGTVLQAFAIGLVPFSIFQLVLRIFYSLGDTRTPVALGLLNVVLNAGLGLVASLVLPPEYAVMGLALSFSIAYFVGSIVAWLVAARRVGGLDGPDVAFTITRMHLAALPMAAIALFSLFFASNTTGMTIPVSLAVIAVGAGLGGALYLAIAHWLRIPEVRSIVGLVTGRVRPGR